MAAAAVERRTQWAAADTSVAVERRAWVAAVACILAVRRMLAAARAWAAVECVLAAHRMLAARRAWAVGHASEADPISAEQQARGLAAERRECDLPRGRVSKLSDSMLSGRLQRMARTGTPRSGEINKQPASAETETQA
jgi:hypothetical protein